MVHSRIATGSQARAHSKTAKVDPCSSCTVAGVDCREQVMHTGMSRNARLYDVLGVPNVRLRGH